ncbi:MFS transporter [Sphaerotilaceae bacterium SBD11-9]
MRTDRRWPTVAALGCAQTLAWASTYYLPAMLAAPMARDLGVSTPLVFAAFSAALVVSAFLGPLAGHAIDRWGGRPVLVATNLVFAAGLALLSQVTGVIGLFAAWALIGVGMGSGLYEAAFATLVRLYGSNSRNAITGITLIAGFASTVGWPLSTLFEAEWGWRGACLAWAALHLVVGIPLNGSLPRVQRLGAQHSSVAASQETSAPAPESGSSRPRVAAAMLAFVFAVTWFISTAMAAHLPRLLEANGLTLAAAVALGALVGPSQVAGRLLEFGFLRHVHPLLSARLAALAHPIGAVGLLIVGGPVAAVFAVLHGAGNGILTIAKGSLPLVLFGPHGYGARQGLLMVPARIAQALAPLAFGVCLDRWGGNALWLSVLLGLAAFVALLTISVQPAADPTAARSA